MKLSKRTLLAIVILLTGGIIVIHLSWNSRQHQQEEDEMKSELSQEIPVYTATVAMQHDKWPRQILATNPSKPTLATQTVNEGTTVITGSLTTVTYSILSYLYSRHTDIVLLDNFIHPSFDISRDRQQAIDKFVKHSHKYKVFKESDIVSWFKTKQKRSEDVSTLIYNCHVTLHDELVSKTMGIQHYTKVITDFVHVLNYISTNDHKDSLRVVLIVTIVDNHIHQASMELFIMILYSYQSSYNLEISIAFIKEDFNEDYCSNFDELLHFIVKANNTRVHDVFECVSKHSTVQKNTTNVLFSTYFTDNRQFKRPYRENSFQFVKGFVITAKQHNSRIVIYYDRIDPGYRTRLLEYYNNIEFIHYKGNFHHRTINDARFYIMYEYLLAHPEIERIILQDLRDGIFLNDPFKVMELAGDYLFVGMDVSFRGKMIGMYVKRCEKKLHLPHSKDRYYPMLNAGTLGGTRHIVLAYLKQIVKSFDEIFPQDKNCNMDAFDFTAHYYFHDLMYTGYPFQGFMQLMLTSPRGIAIRHKRTKFDL